MTWFTNAEDRESSRFPNCVFFAVNSIKEYDAFFADNTVTAEDVEQNFLKQ